jgi:hypothetical protein
VPEFPFGKPMTWKKKPIKRRAMVGSSVPWPVSRDLGWENYEKSSPSCLIGRVHPQGRPGGRGPRRGRRRRGEEGRRGLHRVPRRLRRRRLPEVRLRDARGQTKIRGGDEGLHAGRLPASCGPDDFREILGGNATRNRHRRAS